jgi:hypothetical protein
MVRAGEGARIAEAIARADPGSPEAERTALAALLAPKSAQAPERAGERLRPDVTLTHRLRGRSLVLRLEGPGVTPALAAEARALLQRLGSGENG